MGINKYGPDASSSHLGIKSLGTRIPRTVTPHSLGSVDYPSTRGIQVDVGLPDTTSENRAKTPLYEELYPNTLPA